MNAEQRLTMLQHAETLHDLQKEAQELESLAIADKSNLIWINTYSASANQRWTGSSIVLERLRDYLRGLMADRVKEIEAETSKLIDKMTGMAP